MGRSGSDALSSVMTRESGVAGGGGGGDSKSLGQSSSNAATAAPKVEAVPAEKPDFGLSGALSADTKTGNVYRGVVLKWSEPSDAKCPPESLRWRIYVFKG